jgi:hypothetical protein
VVAATYRYGADKTIQNAKGLTALDIALAENREEIAELIQTWSMNGQERTEVPTTQCFPSIRARTRKRLS